MAEQGVPIFAGPVGQVSDEVFDLLTGGFPKSLGAAEIDGVGLDQVRVELVLTNQLAKAVTDSGTAVVSINGMDPQFRRSREDETGSPNEPISSTEQMPIP